MPRDWVKGGGVISIADCKLKNDLPALADLCFAS